MLLFFDKSDIFNKNVPDNILGVYYFLDANMSILYIGKSVDVKKRLAQHIYKVRKRLIDSFHSVKIKQMKSELEALLFESQEVKKNKPIFNRRLRQSKTSISLYSSIDNLGYQFYFLSHNSLENPLIDFFSKRNAEKFILKLTQKYKLCEKINGLDKSSKSCFQYHLKNCKGACLNKETFKDYNKRFQHSFNQILRYPLDCKLSFMETNTYVVIRNNKVCEFGVLNNSQWQVDFPSNDELRIVNTFKNKAIINSEKFKIEYI